ncbi:class I adenylate-forming enzyme family protein [Streptomyces sp. Y7]|uniref:class I adenylate-forming enzyme family protein n=1 Tax=Streptomyces sp. Y7 TaxID=3342392 RepID=UPI0037230058
MAVIEVPDTVANAATRFPERTAVVAGDRSLTFADVHDRAARLAGAWRAAGLEPGDRVALLAQNEAEYLEIQVAAQRAELILVPVNHRLSVPEIVYIVGDSGPKLLLHGPGCAAKAEAIGLPNWHLGHDGHGESYEEQIASAEPYDSSFLAPERIASILYTSGTTGRPKGAVITNASLWARINSFVAEYSLRPGDVLVQALPMFHIASNVTYSFAYMGGTNIMVPSYSPELVLRLIEEHGATHVLLVPTLINQLANHPAIGSTDLRTLREIQYGGSTISPQVLHRAMGVFRCRFIQTYGSTEIGVATALRGDDHDPVEHVDLLGSAGTDAVSMVTRIADPFGQEAEVGQVGEVLVRGPGLMSGYWNNPSATAEAIHDGWMHTGDLGYRSPAGYLYIVDRLKDLIISGGENVYPREVEDVLYEHPAVREVSVIGLPDPQWGERVHACVTVHPAEQATGGELREFCQARLAGYKVPKTFSFLPELPKNAGGKILKRKLRAAVASAVEASSEHDRVVPANERAGQ